MKRKLDKIKGFYKLYTTGLTRREIEQLLQRDAVGALTYFQKGAGTPERKTRSPLRAFLDIFISFLMKLTPARRLMYGLVILLFIGGLVRTHHLYLILSFIGVNFLLALELVDKLTTRDELEIAREIQMSLQPDQLPNLRMLSMACYSKPAKLVGGDFYDVVQPNPDWVVGIVGDVSGKGISAALYAAYAQSMFQSLSTKCGSPAELLKSLNTLISQRLRDGDFITALVACFDLKERSVTIARAGHNWPLYYSAADGNITELRPKGISIGLFTGPEFDDNLEEQKIFLKNGDCLVFYSDGITEATNSQRHMFDISGLKSAVSESVQGNSDAIIRQINLRLHDFVKSDELQDDATLMTVKID
jgi:serine phosphatase RsbU (regulator of sigma subunit)